MPLDWEAHSDDYGNTTYEAVSRADAGLRYRVEPQLVGNRVCYWIDESDMDVLTVAQRAKSFATADEAKAFCESIDNCGATP